MSDLSEGGHCAEGVLSEYVIDTIRGVLAMSSIESVRE